MMAADLVKPFEDALALKSQIKIKSKSKGKT